MKIVNAALVCWAAFSWASGESTEAQAADAKNGAEAGVKFEVRGLQPTYHRFGPVRKDMTYRPGERLCLRYDLYGCGLNDARATDVDVSYRIVNAEGKVRQATSHAIEIAPWSAEDAFVRVMDRCILDDMRRPGKYTLEIALEDRITGQEASASLLFTVKPTELAVVSPRFYHDENRTCPAPLSGLINQCIYLDCDVLGEDRSQNKVDVSVSVDLVDAAGKSVFQGPDVFGLVFEGDQMPRNISQHLGVHWRFDFRRAGKYKLRIAVFDKLGGGTAKLELPLEVRRPAGA